MATTGTEIYEDALVLMDSNNDADTSDYDTKALSLINGVLGVLFPYSDNYDEAVREANGRRPICPPIEDLDDVVGLDDYICRSVIPPYLGAMMLMDENPSTANTLLQLYYERLNDLKSGRGRPVFGSEDIGDVYSSNGKGHYYYNKFTRWGS